MTSLLVIFRAFLFIFFSSPPTLNLKKNHLNQLIKNFGLMLRLSVDYMYFSTYKLPHNNTSNITGGGDCNKTLSEDDPCWSGASVSRMNAYRIFVVSYVHKFIKLISCWTQLSMTFQRVIKTKILQNKEFSCFRAFRLCIYPADKYYNANNC